MQTTATDDSQNRGDCSGGARDKLLGRSATTSILGYIREGVVKIGDTIDRPHQQGVLTVGSVDFADNITEHNTWIALHFLENPASADLEQAFPVGTLIHIYAGEQLASEE